MGILAIEMARPAWMKLTTVFPLEHYDFQPSAVPGRRECPEPAKAPATGCGRSSSKHPFARIVVLLHGWCSGGDIWYGSVLRAAAILRRGTKRRDKR